MAATKEALAIIVDVGPSMDQAPPGVETALQQSLTAVSMILQRKMFAVSKDEITLVLCGTPTTENDLADGESYEHITVVRPLSPVDWTLLQYVQNDISPSNTSGDFLDAIVVAMDYVMKGIQGKRGFASRRVILFSNVAGEFGNDQLSDIVASMKEFEVDFNVIGPNLDGDSDGGSPPTGASNSDAKAKSATQLAGEAVLRNIIELVNGESYSFSEVLPALSFFQSRSVRPTPWKCPMEIGNSLVIPINGYIKVKEDKAKSFKKVYAKEADVTVQNVRTFHLNDDAETEIEREDTVEGHRYGSTLVPFSADDKAAMKFKAEKCFKVLGFTKSENVKRHLMLGDSSMMVVAEKGDEAAAIALSALIQALYETNMAIIVRRCYSAASTPRIGVLVPHIKIKYECLFYTELPFSEDVRQFTFAPLQTKGEATGANKKLAPTESQLDAMDKLIDSMDLIKPENDDEDAEELLKPKLVFNPYLQRLYQCLQHRALNPDDPLPELSPVIANYLKPPQEVLTRCEPVIDEMRTKFKLTDVSKKKAELTGDNMFKGIDGSGEPATKKIKVDDDLDGGMANLIKAKVIEVGTVHPVEDFLSLISQKDADKFDPACAMMTSRIVRLVKDSFGSQFYSKAMDCLRVLREQAIQNGEPNTYNTFLRSFKVTLTAKGGRKDFWEEAMEEKLSLITKLETEGSDVTKAEAEEFARGAAVKVQQTPKDEGDVDSDDLLGQM